MKRAIVLHPRTIPDRGGSGKSLHQFLIPLLLLLVQFNSYAQKDGIPRGAQLPYTRYESENATRGGAASLQSAPTYDQNAIASEASGQKYVSLPSNGSYVEWTTTAAFQGVNIRFTMPDNGSGTGQSGALTLYVNGQPVKTMNLSSYWAYQYFPNGATEPVQTPGGKTFMRFDEIHFKLSTSYNAGSTVRVVKENGDALEYGVDFLELEPIPVALGAPANSLSVTSFGAVADDQNDDFAAFNACISAAASQGKNVYIPAGRFLLSDKLTPNVTGMKIQGAGIWHTEIYFSTNKQFYGGILARSSNVEISDFSMNTANNGRFKYDEANARVAGDPYKIYKGFMGTYGTSSRIHDVWVEHFECGFWIAGYDPPYPIDITDDLIITRARIRNNYADGVNFCQGTKNSVVEYSSIRNEGDDGLAMWPNNEHGATEEVNNIFRYNTIENTWRAGGVAIFGGYGHQIYRCIIKDGVGGSAIRFTNDFGGFHFEQNSPKIIATDNYIENCGTSYDLWNQRRGAIEVNTPQGLYDVEFNNTKIINSQRHAIQLWGNVQGMVFNNTTIDGTGLDAYTDQPTADDWGGFGLEASASGNVTFNNVSFNRIESYKAGTDPVFGNIKNHNTGFVINVNNTNVPLTGITLSPATVSLAEGKTSQLSVTFNPTNATNKTLNWSSSNAAVATVTATGTGIADVKAIAIGTATITVTTVDGSFSKTCTVSVTPAVNIVATDASAGEGGNVGVFTISTSATSANITVPYGVSGTASSSDYTPGLSGSVTLTPANPSATITITPTDDTNFEGTETLTLTIQSGTGYSLGGNTSATVSISDNDNPPCTAPVIGFTSTAPVIDQSIDAAWSGVPSGTISNVTLGSMPSDFAGSKWRAMYDNSNLYLLVEVKDNTKTNDSGTSWWEDDVVEIFIDGDNSKGTSYDGINDFQLGFRYNDANINIGGGSVTRTTGISFAIQNVTGGYNLEAKIPWSTIGVSPAIGNKIGLDVEVDDDDNGGTRDSQVSAFATTSMAWSNPQLFGSVYLTSCSGVPNVPVTSVVVSPTTVTLNVNGTQQLTATVSPSNATNQTVTWSTNNTSVATVSSTGLVTAVAAGTATITATTQDGNKTATCAVTVNSGTIAVTGVSVSPATASLSAGGTQQLAATVSPSNATNKAVTWTTSNASAATVSSSGLVTAVAAGTATITATTQDGGKTSSCAVTVTSNTQGPFGGTAWAVPGVIEAENFDTGGEGIAYHDNEVANQGGQGRTTEWVDVEACSEGGLNVGWTNTGEWLEYTVNVATAGAYNIDVRTASQFDGGTFHIEFGGVDKTGLMTTPNTGAWQTWSTASKTNVTLSAGVQVMRIYMDNANYNINKVTITSAANVPVTGVSVSPTTATISAGSAQQLTATISPSNATNKTVSWSTSNASVATVNASGLVTAVATGTATITVTTQDGSKTSTSAITVTAAAGTIACLKAPGAITVNGQLTEAGWSFSQSIAKATVGSPNNTATFGVMWDNSNLYIGAKVLDANLNTDSSDPWDDDAIEVYIDANNNKAASYDGLDNQIIKGYNKSTVFTKLALSGLQHGWSAISGGYSIEIAVPWSSLGITPAVGTSVGFDIGYDDDDNSGARDAQAVWNGTINNYQNTSGFGTLTLSNTLAARMSTVVASTETEEVRIEIVPNPIKNGLTRVLIPGNRGIAPLKVFSMEGRIVYEGLVEGQEKTIDLSLATKGIYLLKVNTNNNVVVKKIMLE